MVDGEGGRERGKGRAREMRRGKGIDGRRTGSGAETAIPLERDSRSNIRA